MKTITESLDRAALIWAHAERSRLRSREMVRASRWRVCSSRLALDYPHLARMQGGSDKPPVLAGVHVILVEDHQDTREMLAYVLHAAGAKVTAAGAARDVVDSLAEAHIVVTDMHLPGEDGYWLLGQAQKLPRPVPVISLTGVAPAFDSQLAQSGFARTVLKPVDPWDLCEHVAEVLGR